MEKIIESSEVLESATLMVQEEVARRCVAMNGTADFSSLTVFLQYFATVKYGFLVPPKCFYPAPKVESAVIHLLLGKRFPVADEERFLLTMRTAFQHRRKMMKSSLRNLYAPEKIEAALLHSKKSALARPEELSLEEWVQLYTYVSTC